MAECRRRGLLLRAMGGAFRPASIEQAFTARLLRVCEFFAELMQLAKSLRSSAVSAGQYGASIFRATRMNGCSRFRLNVCNSRWERCYGSKRLLLDYEVQGGTNETHRSDSSARCYRHNRVSERPRFRREHSTRPSFLLPPPPPSLARCLRLRARVSHRGAHPRQSVGTSRAGARTYLRLS